MQREAAKDAKATWIAIGEPTAEWRGISTAVTAATAAASAASRRAQLSPASSEAGGQFQGVLACGLLIRPSGEVGHASATRSRKCALGVVAEARAGLGRLGQTGLQSNEYRRLVPDDRPQTHNAPSSAAALLHAAGLFADMRTPCRIGAAARAEGRRAPSRTDVQRAGNTREKSLAAANIEIGLCAGPQSADRLGGASRDLESAFQSTLPVVEGGLCRQELVWGRMAPLSSRPRPSSLPIDDGASGGVVSASEEEK